MSYTHISLLVDKSGSMSGAWGETVQSLNTFLKDQKKEPGKLTLSLITFNTKVEEVINFCDAEGINEIKLGSPMGGTSLYDAFVLSVDSLGAKLRNLSKKDRPNKILFVLMTDGEENSSKKYTKFDVKNRLEHQQSVYEWNFLFLGADFDVTQLAEDVGLSKDFTFNYGKQNTEFAGLSVSNAVSSYRSSNTRSLTGAMVDKIKADYNDLSK